jgi:Pyruvate formate lyase.
LLPGTKMGEYGPLKMAEVFGAEQARIEPYMLTWARALAKVNDEIPVFIVDHSRIVGAAAGAPHKIFWAPVGAFQMNDDLFNDRDDLVDEDVRDDVGKALDVLKPYTMQALVERLLSNRQKIMARTSQTFTGGKHLEGGDYCTSQFDYYKRGFKAIIGEIDQHLSEAKDALYKVGAKPDWESEYYYLGQTPVSRVDNWQAMKINLESVSRYAKRLARLARIIAENFESDPERKQELVDIGERCDWVSENRPRTFPRSCSSSRFRPCAANASNRMAPGLRTPTGGSGSGTRET